MAEERRQYERIMLRGEATLRAEDGTTYLGTAPLRDISSGGFCVFGQEGIEAGRIVGFDLTLQMFGDILSGKGRVCYAKAAKANEPGASRVGIEFTDVNRDLVAYMINRIHQKIVHAMKQQRCSWQPDCVPY
jgi:c-di-GMP-binding flagellar brake protein YcgR